MGSHIFKSMEMDGNLKSTRSFTSVILLNPESPKSDCTNESQVVPDCMHEDVGYNSDSQPVPCAGGSPTMGVPLSQTELYYAQKQHITDLEQRIKDSEENLQREIALREHFELEGLYANDACDEIYGITVAMSETMSKTERHLEMRFLAMQHTIALWEAWAIEHGIPIVKNSGDVPEVVAENSCTSD